MRPSCILDVKPCVGLCECVLNNSQPPMVPPAFPLSGVAEERRAHSWQALRHGSPFLPPCWMLSVQLCYFFFPLLPFSVFLSCVLVLFSWMAINSDLQNQVRSGDAQPSNPLWEICCTFFLCVLFLMKYRTDFWKFLPKFKVFLVRIHFLLLVLLFSFHILA